MARKLDRSKPFGSISRLNPKPGDAAFEQGGYLFNSADDHVGEVDGFQERQAAADAQEIAEVEAQEAADTADRAAAILGDLGGDPAADAQRENAAAEAAETLSDDAQASE